MGTGHPGPPQAAGGLAFCSSGVSSGQVCTRHSCGLILIDPIRTHPSRGLGQGHVCGQAKVAVALGALRSTPRGRGASAQHRLRGRAPRGLDLSPSPWTGSCASFPVSPGGAAPCLKVSFLPESPILAVCVDPVPGGRVEMPGLPCWLGRRPSMVSMVSVGYQQGLQPNGSVLSILAAALPPLWVPCGSGPGTFSPVAPAPPRPWVRLHWC